MKSFVAFLEHGGVQVDPPSWDCSAARCACCAIERGYAGAWFEALVAKHVGALLVRLHDRDDGALVPARTSEVTKRKPCRQSSQVKRTHVACPCQHVQNARTLPVGGGRDAVHVLHLGGVGKHGGRHVGGRKAVDLRAADAVVGGLCSVTKRQDAAK